MDNRGVMQPDDIMIVERDLGVLVYGVEGHGGAVVDTVAEAEDLIIENEEDKDRSVWYIVRTSEETADPTEHEFGPLETIEIEEGILLSGVGRSRCLDNVLEVEEFLARVPGQVRNRHFISLDERGVR